MFRIGFTEEPLTKMYSDEEGIVGQLVLGGHEERFVAHLNLWAAQQYLDHWRSALIRTLSGEPSALITDMQTPEHSSHLVWWPTWRIGDAVIFHNQLLFFEQHNIRDTSLEAESLYYLVGDRSIQNEDGVPLSEWVVPVSDVENFLREAW